MSQPNLLSAQPPLDPTATSPSFVVIDPTSRQSRLASPTASSSSSSGKKLQQRRRRRSLVVRNSLQATVPLLPAIFFPPNLPRPQPAPGLMPTRGGGQKSVESRTLAAAHTQFRAKTVFFYKDGDNYFTPMDLGKTARQRLLRVAAMEGQRRASTSEASRLPRIRGQPATRAGVRVPICKARFRTMDALMDSLNESIALPYGVRQLHTPTGRTAIRSLDELQPQGRYIAASSIRRVRGVDLEAVERRKRLREDAQRRWNFQQSMPAPDSGGSSAQVQQQQQPSRSAAVSSSGKSEGQPFRGRVRSSHGDYELTNRTNPFLPVTSKQIYFVLNGHPHCVYRALVNPLRRGHLLDSLLEEVSEGLQAAIFRIYSFEGDRILSVDQLLKLKDMRAIAVPRHERLQLNGMTQSDILRLPMRLPGSTSASSLPPIKKDGGSSKNSSSKSSSGGGSQTKVRQPNNNIDRLPAYDDPMVRLNLVEVNRRKRSRSPMRNDSHLPKAAAIPTGGKAGLVAPGTAAMRQRAFTSTAVPVQSQPGAKTATTDATTAASTSNTTADSDSGRPRSAMELELPSQGGPQDELLLQLEEDEREEDEDNEEDEDDQQGDNEEEEDDSSDNEDDYPEEPPELMAIRKRKRRKRQHTIDEEEEEGEGAIDMGNRDAEEEETRGLKQLPADDDERVEEMERRNGKEEEDGRRQPSGRPQASSSRKSTQIEVIHSDEHGHPIGGQYSEELELILYGQAAVKIQSAWRGYAARKELKRTRFAEHPTYINEDQASSRRGAKASSHSNFYKPNERHQAIVQRVKTPMPGQKGPNSVLKKKSSTLLNPSDYGTETLADSASDREDINVLELVQAKKGLGWEMADPQKSPSLSRRSPKTEYIYTVTLITGNRWAADTEADVYVQLQGAEMDSGKLWLRQEFTNWLQCAPNGQRFRQNQSDSFTFRLPRRIGIIKKVTVGHECRGYGAGIFIDRILVTEDEEESEDDCRQFLFLCNKWFDSGQVDGKLERTIRLSAFYEIGSIPVDNRVTRGRWEFVLHNGTEKGQGGTSSLLTITGYGTRGQSSTEGLFDSNMAKVPSESLMQVDFGDIGELLKIRIEIDGNGSNPDYFLNFVEFKDLDTDERFVVMCGKWLRWASTKKGEQPFRELFAFHIGVEPLPLIAYEGKVRVLAPRIDCLSQREVQMELHGDLGETGFFRVDLASPALQSISGQQQKFGEEAAEEEENELNGNAAEKIDIAFRVEAVSVGRVTGARVQFQPNQMGHQIVEGLVAVQQLFQKQGLWPLAANSEFLVGRILLRESAHTPYRYVLTRSQFQEVASTSADSDSQHFTKEMLTTEMQGISTRLPKRKEPARVPPNWLLQMSLAYGSTLLPEVFLCGENGTARMLPLDTSPSDGMLSFQPENAEDIGSLRKVRICTDGLALLTGQANDTARQQTGTDDEPSTLVEKIRVCDTANGQELRFPAADCQLQRHSVFEMSAIWPDRPPTPIVIYLIRIVSGEAHSSPNPALTVRLNLFGEFGDVGWRTLSAQESERPGPAAAEQPQQQIALFAPKTKNSFEFEAVSIGEIESAELEVRSQDENFRWECTEMVVTDTNTALFYTFALDRPFSAERPAQRCQTLPFTNAL